MNVDLVALLLRHGADPNLATPLTGQTPAHIAASGASCQELRTADSLRLLELLLAHGASPRALCLRGLAPIGYTQNPAVQQLLRRADRWWAAKPLAWIRSRGRTPGLFGELLEDHLRLVAGFL